MTHVHWLSVLRCSADVAALLACAQATALCRECLGEALHSLEAHLHSSAALTIEQATKLRHQVKHPTSKILQQ